MANKLELTWYGKDEPIRVEPRLLIENTALSNTAADPDTQNMLIHGDNLLALKALESKFAGQVKCIYIDPPFNTGQAFENYDDNLEMSIWLDLMRSRLQIIHTLLKDDGTLFVHIDDQNLPYLTLLLDEIFGKQNRLYLITFKQGAATGHKAINPGCVTTTNFILIILNQRNTGIQIDCILTEAAATSAMGILSPTLMILSLRGILSRSPKRLLKRENYL